MKLTHFLFSLLASTSLVLAMPVTGSVLSREDVGSTPAPFYAVDSYELTEAETGVETDF